MKKLNFYSFKTKKHFETDDYEIVEKSGKRFAVAEKDGIKCYRIVGKDF